MNILVLAGGLSPERDVSLSSGTQVCTALREAGHNAILVDLYYGVNELPTPAAALFSSKSRLVPRPVLESAPDLEAVRKVRPAGDSPLLGKNVIALCKAADLVFLALHGGDGENGKLQGFFDMLGVRYTGAGQFGCALAMNKWVSKQLFSAAGLRVPDCVLMKESELRDLGDLALPLVVKPCSGGSSIGISIVKDSEELANALCEAFRYEPEVLLETYIPGRELSCAVLGGRALPVIEIKPRSGFYDYAHKYQPGWSEEVCPAQLSPEVTKQIQDMAVSASRALHLEVYARFDFMLKENGEAYLLEANTLPGMTPTSLVPQEAAAEGMDYAALCDRIVSLSMEKYR